MTVLTLHSQAHKRIGYIQLLLLLLFFYCCTTICSATTEHRCIHDSILEEAGLQPTAVVMELPRRKRSAVQLLTVCGSEWKPIRFSVFTEDMNNESRYCSAVGQERPNFQGGTVTCKAEHILTDAKRDIIVNQILPRATKLHSERLLVEPMTSSIFVVPNDMRGLCSDFTVPSSHHTGGVEDADMVLYVAAGPTEFGILAWAAPCALLENRRPVVGVININPSEATSREFFVRIAAHEIAHTLGFSTYFFWRTGMVSTRTGVRGKLNVTLVGSTKVVEKARAHYNCPTAPGMELEDEGGRRGVGSHWEARNAKDELMAPAAGIGYYSALTMAVFEDLGFFRANWSMAETMNWGRNAGCDFLEKKCVSNGTTAYPDMFCTKKNNDIFVLSCTSDRLGLGRCQIKTYENFLPFHFQYFIDPRVGSPSDTLTDHCPIVLPYSDTQCADGLTSYMPGSIVGPSSRCLKGDYIYLGDLRLGDVCAEVRCNHGSVSVRHFGNETWHECHEGESIRLTGHLRGRIFCPKYSEVCYETGRDKGEVDLRPTKAKMNDAHTNVTLRQRNGIRLFVPWVTKVPEKVGDVSPVNDVESFKSPFLVSTVSVMVAFAEAVYVGRNGKVHNDIAARYIETEGNDWAKKAEICEKRWKTRLAMQLNGLNYRFQLKKPLAVGKDKKIYLLAVSYAHEKVQSNDWLFKGWSFVVTVGEVKAKNYFQGGKTIDWQPLRLLDHTFVKEFKSKSTDMLPHGGSAFLTKGGDVVFVLKGTDGDKYISAILCLGETERGDLKYEWSFVKSDPDCYFPSFFEWEGKLVMVPNCETGDSKVKESIDMGKTWTDAAGPFPALGDGLKNKGDFTTVTIEDKNVLLYTEQVTAGTGAGEVKGTRLFFTDGYGQSNFGPIFPKNSGDAILGGLCYTKGELFSLYLKENNKGSTDIILKRLKDKVDLIRDVPGIWKTYGGYRSEPYNKTAGEMEKKNIRRV